MGVHTLQGLCHNDLRASSVLLTSRRFWKPMLNHESCFAKVLASKNSWVDREADARVLVSDVGVLGAMGIGDWHFGTILAASIFINLLGCVPFVHVSACPIVSQFEHPHSRIQRWFATQS